MGKKWKVQILQFKIHIFNAGYHGKNKMEGPNIKCIIHIFNAESIWILTKICVLEVRVGIQHGARRMHSG